MENKIYTKDGVTIAANTGRILSSEKVLVTPEVPEQIIPAWTEEVQDGFEIIYHPEEIIPA